jgi:hypothetical protein
MRIPLLIALSVLFGNVALAQKPAKEPAKKDAAKPAKDAKQDPKNAKKPAVEQKKEAKKSPEEEKLAAEMAAKGLVDVNGTWVEKDHVEDAKRGVFHFNGELVAKGEYRALQSGKVRHAITGELIAAEDLEKSRGRSFPIDGGKRWVDEKEADAYHGKGANPWMVANTHYVLLSTLPIAKIESLREHADRAIAQVSSALGEAKPVPAQRPAVFVAPTQDEFIQFGTRLGDETSAYGAFLAREEALLDLPLQGEVRPAVSLWDEGWGPYYLPHAVGLAYVHGIVASCEAELPAWLLHGLASSGSRFGNPDTGKWFCQNLAKGGGLKPLDKFFSAFAIDGEMESDAISANLTQAGFLIDFAKNGGDKDVASALAAFGEAMRAQKASGIDKAAKALQSALGKSQDAIDKHLQKQVR